MMWIAALAEQCLARIAQQSGEDLVLMARSFETAATLAYSYQIGLAPTRRDSLRFFWLANLLSSLERPRSVVRRH